MPWRDRLFGAYRDGQRAGLAIGVLAYANPCELYRRDSMLLLPSTGEVEDCAISQRNYSGGAAC